MKRVCVLSFSPLRSDPRVQRQIVFLKNQYKVTAAGYSDPEQLNVEFVLIPPTPRSKLFAALTLIFRVYSLYYWSHPDVRNAKRALQKKTFDLYIANDLDTLPLALHLAGRAKSKVLFDAHEYGPGEKDSSWKFRLFFKGYKKWISRRFVSRASALTAVCVPMVLAYRKDSGLDGTVITNAPFYEDLPVQESLKTEIRMVHHGAAIRDRQLEFMLDLMTKLDHRFCLDLFLVPTEPLYFVEIQERALQLPNVRIQAPVPVEDLPRTLNSYDIGLCMIKPLTTNHYMVLPNKLFEWVQARLAIVTWPTGEMPKVINQWNLGIVTPTFDINELAKVLMQLTPGQINFFKRASDKAAHELSANKNKVIFLKIVAELMSG